MVEEEENYYVESVGGVDENILSTSFTHMPSSSISDVESMHVQAPNMS